MEKIIGTALLALIGVLVYYLKSQTKRQNKREDKRDDRDADREKQILNIVDVTLKNVEKVVIKDSENTVKVEKTMSRLEKTIENHLVHSIDDLTIEVKRMNNKK